MLQLKNKKILIVGFARSGIALAKFLAKKGAKITITDLKRRDELQGNINLLSHLKKITYELGKHQNKTFLCADLIIISPGVAININPLKIAKKKGIKIISELAFAAQFIKKPIIAITGTNGKTTTATMLTQIFRNAKKKFFLGGNIGVPLTQFLLDPLPVKYLIIEVSSFQLEVVEKFRPKIALLLNLSPDHLDRHCSFEEYANLKARIFQNQKATDIAILNYNDPQTKNIISQIRAKKYFFSSQYIKEPGIYLKENKFFLKAQKYREQYKLDKLKIHGLHNKENFAAAILAAKFCGCKGEAIQKTIDSFAGVPHRLEHVTTKNAVHFFNDSKGTNVDSVVKSLQSFTNPIILIMGGRDKGGDFTKLVPLVKERVKTLILLGEAKEIINRTLGDYTQTFLVGTLDEAVLLAYQQARSNDIILFSPGCSSFDMFKDYADRGDYFKKIVASFH